MRALAILAGLGLLAAATWAVISDANLSSHHAALVAAMACGTAAGALVLARSTWRIGLVVLLAVLVGETYGILATAERIIKHRESQAATDARASPAAARARDDLAAARKAIVEHDNAARQRVAEKTCGAECRGLLDRTRASLMADRDAAAAAFVAVPGSSTPLADRLGVSAWVLDLFSAGLLALGANGLACVLIAWGAHAPKDAPNAGRNHDVTPAPDVAESHDVGGRSGGADVSEPAAGGDAGAIGRVIALRRRANGRDARRFALECLRPERDASVSLRDIAESYWRWCDQQSIGRPDMATTVTQIIALFGAIKVETEMTPQREVLARGIALTG